MTATTRCAELGAVRPPGILFHDLLVWARVAPGSEQHFHRILGGHS
jgi:hypothetical protein